jgi:hypothetical protein
MEEYVWISKAINIDIFTTHAHPVVYRLGREWNVDVTIAGAEDLQDEPFIQASMTLLTEQRVSRYLDGA